MRRATHFLLLISLAALAACGLACEKNVQEVHNRPVHRYSSPGHNGGLNGNPSGYAGAPGTGVRGTPSGFGGSINSGSRSTPSTPTAQARAGTGGGVVAPTGQARGSASGALTPGGQARGAGSGTAITPTGTSRARTPGATATVPRGAPVTVDGTPWSPTDAR